MKALLNRKIIPITLLLIGTFLVTGEARPFYIFHWHMKHELDKKSLKKLAEIPVRGLYYRTGHFSFAREKPHFRSIKKRWGFLNKFSKLQQFEEIHLCYSFGNSHKKTFVKGYLNPNPEEAVPFISDHVIKDYNFFHKINPKVKGVMLDLEGSKIQFDLYAKILRTIRKELPHVKISITPMSSWVKKKAFKQVADESDFLVPMLYDFHRGRSPDNPLKVTDYHWLKKMVRLYDTMGKPVIYGLPSYSYCVIYDEKKKLRIPWALISPDGASQNLALSPVQMSFNHSKHKEGSFRQLDRVLEYKIQSKTNFSNITFRPGSVLKFNFISPSALNQYIEAVKQAKGKHDAGIAFFRFGIPGEALVLDAWRLHKAIRGQYPSKFKIRIQKIDLGKNKFRLAFTNLGSSSYFGIKGFKATLGDYAKTADQGDFDLVSFNSKEQKLSFLENYFQKYEMLVTGPVEAVEPVLHMEFTGDNGVALKRSVKLDSADLTLE